jgi:hypothetical protein
VTDGPPLCEHVEQAEKECWELSDIMGGVLHQLVIDFVAVSLEVMKEDGKVNFLERKKCCFVSK